MCVCVGRPGQRARADEDKLSEMEARLMELERKNESLASKVKEF